jgi:hypothetical protein
MTLRTCARCGRITGAGERYCATHQTAENQRQTAKTREYGYRRKHWRTIRKQRLEAAGYVCELQLPGCTTRASHVHLAAEYRGQHDIAELEHTRACCPSCSGAVDAPRSHAAH